MEIIFWIVVGAVLWSLIGKASSTKEKNVHTPTINYNSIQNNFVAKKRRASRRYLTLEKPDVILSEESRKILELIENTNTNTFITGRAGTGKSTLLKYFRATTKKNIVALAPTGVAAVNIQGQTIHSFFHFPITVTEDNVKKDYKRADLYKKLDTIIIDEISMVRADLFDCLEKFLRLNGPLPEKPFGGIQVIVVGDLYQLPPVVTREEKPIFEKHYRSPYFFDSRSYERANFVVFELADIYRQSNEEFIKILDSIRVYSATDDHIKKINEQFNKEYVDNDFKITLVTTNTMANEININELNKLPGKSRQYIGSVSGDFRERDLPTEKELFLRPGSQIMLLNNDSLGRWANGDLARIISLSEESIRVLFEDGSYDDVIRYKWDKVLFVYDDEEDKIRSEIVGSFVQFPMRLAWALTIHKGQGKTFEKVIVDFGEGTFVPGQAYVALSRCKSLEGLLLKSLLEHKHLIIDNRINEFMNNVSNKK